MKEKKQDIRWLCIIGKRYTGSGSSGAVSKNIQCKHENVFEWWKKVRKNNCGHAYNHFIFPNPSDTCLKGKLCFKSLADINNSPLSSYIMFEVVSGNNGL